MDGTRIIRIAQSGWIEFQKLFSVKRAPQTLALEKKVGRSGSSGYPFCDFV